MVREIELPRHQHGREDVDGGQIVSESAADDGEVAVAEAEIHEVACGAEDGRFFRRGGGAEEAKGFAVHGVLVVGGGGQVDDVVEGEEGDGGDDAGFLAGCGVGGWVCG